MKTNPNTSKRPLAGKILAVAGILACLVSCLVLPTSAEWYSPDTAFHNYTYPMYGYTLSQDERIYDEYTDTYEYLTATQSSDVIAVPTSYGRNELDGYEVESANGMVMTFRANADYTNVAGYVTSQGQTPRGYLGLFSSLRILYEFTEADDTTVFYAPNTLFISPTTIWRDGNAPSHDMGSIGNCTSNTAAYTLVATYQTDTAGLVTRTLTGNASAPYYDDGVYTFDIATIFTGALGDDVDWTYPVDVRAFSIRTINVGMDESDVPQQTYALPYLYNASTSPIYPSKNGYDVIERVTETLDLDTFGERIYSAVDNVLSVEIYPNITLGTVFAICMGIILLVVFVKLFAGG